MFSKTYTCPYNSALSLTTISGFALKKVKGFAATMMTMHDRIFLDNQRLVLDSEQLTSLIKFRKLL